LTTNNDRWINQTGLNLIRIVIGSYFMAVSLDLVIGVDQTILFAPFMSAALADLVGSTLIFVSSVLFMTGVALRLTSLFLAMFVLCSSVIQNFIVFEMGNLSDFWRDVALVCAVILNYSALGRRELRRASIIARRTRVQQMHSRHGVAPRRVRLAQGVAKRPPSHADLAGLRQSVATKPTEKPETATTAAQASERDGEPGPLSDNIFANV
jgi:uncharacterized membrane protein YphA (DoxX/SURF4 family)